MTLSAELRKLITENYERNQSSISHSNALEDFVASSELKYKVAYKELSGKLENFSVCESLSNETIDALATIDNAWSLNTTQKSALNQARSYFQAYAHMCQDQIAFVESYARINLLEGNNLKSYKTKSFLDHFKEDIVSRMGWLFATKLPDKVYDAGIKYIIRNLLE